MTRRLSLNGIRAFEVTARAGSVSTAANTLHVTPSAVSHQLRRLEEQLGQKLFVRRGKRLVLTEAGALYHKEVTAAFDQLDAATRRLRQRHEQRAVRFTTFPAFAIKWLVPRLAAFHTHHRAIEIRMSTSYRTVDLRKSGDDLGIRWGSGHWSGVESTRLMGDTIQPVCSPRLLRRRTSIRRASDLLRYPLIHLTFVRDDWKIWEDANGVTRPPESSELRFNEPLSAIQAAIDGMGIVLGPRCLVHDDICAGRLCAPWKTSLQLSDAYYVVGGKDLEGNSSAALFRRWLTETAAEFESGQRSGVPLSPTARIPYPRSRD